MTTETHDIQRCKLGHLKHHVLSGGAFFLQKTGLPLGCRGAFLREPRSSSAQIVALSARLPTRHLCPMGSLEREKSGCKA
eukprot:3402404-Amphidinium_carterae.1